MKDENYYVVKGWMRNRLDLKGGKLHIYAIIYGFSQDGESWFDGSLSYLQDASGLGRTAVINNLSELVLDGKLKKFTEVWNGITRNKYQAVPPVQKVYHPGTESVPPPRPESVPYNIEIDNTINKKDPPSLFEVPKKETPQLPEWPEFLSYAKKHSPNVNIEHLHLKFEAWRAGGWKITNHQTGKERPIKNWKSTLLQTLPHIKKDQPTQTKKQYY